MFRQIVVLIVGLAALAGSPLPSQTYGSLTIVQRADAGTPLPLGSEFTISSVKFAALGGGLTSPGEFGELFAVAALHDDGTGGRQATFTNLPFGIFTVTPPPASGLEPFTLKIPTTHPDGNRFIYDVRIYPKFHFADDAALPGAAPAPMPTAPVPVPSATVLTETGVGNLPLFSAAGITILGIMLVRYKGVNHTIDARRYLGHSSRLAKNAA